MRSLYLIFVVLDEYLHRCPVSAHPDSDHVGFAACLGGASRYLRSPAPPPSATTAAAVPLSLSAWRKDVQVPDAADFSMLMSCFRADALG
jgi:hypothetical protein